MEQAALALRVTPTEAARAIIHTVRALTPEHVSLAEALGRITAENISSPIDLPHWDNSAMDGYAVRSDDVKGNCPTELKVVESVRAGTFPSKELSAGQCARIFTGAPLPRGSDGVIRQEDTTPLQDGRVKIHDDRDVKRNVRRRGEDIKRDTVLVARGSEMGPAQIAILASVAKAEILVHRRPSVAILASGDEIADLEEATAILQGRKIASSNSYALSAMVRMAGGSPLLLGIARDDPEDLRARLASVGEADLLITSGGVSVGEHDYMRSVMQDLGAELRFWRVRMRPGAPVAFGVWNQMPWIGLPGNPVSTMVTFELFVRPAIRKMLGHRCPFRRVVSVRLTEPITLHAELCHFLRVVIEEHDGELKAKLTGPQGSNILTSMAKANALLIVPEGQLQLQEETMLKAILLDETRHVEQVPF
ncbi:MAG: molybdopterin molybdotransferase MoeA [Gemmatimonadales bacterium]